MAKKLKLNPDKLKTLSDTDTVDVVGGIDTTGVVGNLVCIRTCGKSNV